MVLPVSAAFVLVGLAGIAWTEFALATTVATTGKVVDVEWSTPYRRRHGAMTVAYSTGGGTERATVVLNTRRYPLGSSVPVFYEPQHPERALFGDRLDLETTPALAAILGSVVFFGGWVGARWAR